MVYDMLIKDENILLAVGTLSLILSFLIGALHVDFYGFSISDLASGILVGISMALNLTFLLRWRSKRDSQLIQNNELRRQRGT
jgi:cell shape-determining protein MreD